MNRYIADLHLYHGNIIKFDKRPFETVEQMNREIVENWNNIVHKNDTTYILGDFMLGASKDIIPSVCRKLSGHKVLILGNHDAKLSHEYSKHIYEEFDYVCDYLELYDRENQVLLSHYPMIFHKQDYKPNCWMLYGHVHNTAEWIALEKIRAEIKSNGTDAEGKYIHGKARGNFINVGCMMPWMQYTPRTLEEIISGDRQYFEPHSEE